ETALWLESERMFAPFTQMDSARFVAARGAVKNERQQQENNPFSSANPVTIGLLYGDVHPYRNPLGPMDDINHASFSERRTFFEAYYVPNNGVIALSGDFDMAKARAMVQRYFGGIKRGSNVTHPVMQPVMTAERRVALEDPRGRGATLRLAWAGVGFAHP